jgi:SOS response regulatory protein OraA/RecX
MAGVLKSAGVAEKRRAIDILSRSFSSSQEVASYLERLGARRDDPTEVRISAIIGLRDLETGIGLGALE